MKFKFKTKLRSGRGKPPNTFAKAKARYKEDIGILKDTLDVVWKLSPILLVPAGLCIWFYLQSLGWPSLFYKAATSGLAFLVVTAVVTAILVLFLFVTPSALVIITSQCYGQDRTIPEQAVVLYRATLITWVLIVCLIAALRQDIPPLVALLAPIGVASLYGIWKLDSFPFAEGKSFRTLRRWGQVLFMAILATLSMCGTSYALLICFNVVSQFGNVDGLQRVIYSLICIGISMTGVVPGFRYLRARTYHKGHSKPAKLTLSGMLPLCCILIGLAIFVPQSRLVFLRSIGVYSEVRTSFQILKPNLVPAFSAAGLELSQNTGMTTVTACVPYNFAGTLLLCKNSFDPNGMDADAIRKARRDRTLNQAGMHCVPAISGELRELKIEGGELASCIQLRSVSP